MAIDIGRRELIAALGGTAVAWPLAARAQQPEQMRRIGVLAAPAAATYGPYSDAVEQGLRDSGFIAGQNVSLEYRWADGRYEQLPALAADLVDRQVAAIATIGGTPAALAAKKATSTIPIVFAVADDPVRLGLVDSLARPTGNVTGISFLTGDIGGKRLELLRELLPKASDVAVLLNPSNPQTTGEIPQIRQAAAVLGLKVAILNASNEAEIGAAFAAAAQQHSDGVIIGADSYFFSRRKQLVSLAARYALPTIYRYREETADGGLISYGTDIADAYRKEGDYVGRILKGKKPADLPVQQSVKVELVLNLKTAKSLGITFPLPLLGRADGVIE
jgi:putative ABC transport system substrate-binding protein